MLGMEDLSTFGKIDDKARRRTALQQKGEDLHGSREQPAGIHDFDFLLEPWNIRNRRRTNDGLLKYKEHKHVRYEC
jgi:hypothetical protein